MKVVTASIGLNVLSLFFVIEYGGIDWIVTSVSISLVFPVIMGYYYSNAEIHQKIRSLTLILFVLQCGLLALLCFPQGKFQKYWFLCSHNKNIIFETEKALYLAISSLFIVLAIKVKKWFILGAHPFIFCLIDVCCEFYFESETLYNFDLVSVISAWQKKIYLSEYSNMYTLIMFSALPIWSALYVVALSAKSSNIPSDQSSKQKLE